MCERVGGGALAVKRLWRVALLLGLLGLLLAIFMDVMYYAHLLCLPSNPIEAVQYEVSAHSTATILLSASVALGCTALILRRDERSSYLMSSSAVLVALGHVPPCERLLRLGYLDALTFTVAIAAVDVALMFAAAALLHEIHSRKQGDQVNDLA